MQPHNLIDDEEDDWRRIAKDKWKGQSNEKRTLTPIDIPFSYRIPYHTSSSSNLRKSGSIITGWISLSCTSRRTNEESICCLELETGQTNLIRIVNDYYTTKKTIKRKRSVLDTLPYRTSFCLNGSICFLQSFVFFDPCVLQYSSAYPVRL